MKVRIRPFGNIAEHVSDLEFEISEGTTIQEFREILLHQFEILRDLPFSIAVDRILREDGFEIRTPCELALLPPFSGG